jgi:hypothetical protein
MLANIAENCIQCSFLQFYDTLNIDSFGLAKERRRQIKNILYVYYSTGIGIGSNNTA